MSNRKTTCTPIPLFKISWNQNDIRLVNRVIKSGSYWSSGPVIEEFEKKVATYVGRKFAVTFNSGTSALFAILDALGIKPGDEVIIPSFTYIATANAVLYTSGVPIFADIENETYGLDNQDVVRKISTKTKAIMPIHYAGCPCLNIIALRKIAKIHRLWLIEDAAQSLGAKLSGKMAGTFGNAAMFSLCQDKIITTGEGGIAVTDSEEIYQKLLLTRLNHSFRMPSVLAGLGLSQLEQIDQNIKARRQIAIYYNASLKAVSQVNRPNAPKNCFHIYQKYPIELKNRLRDSLQKYLADNSITSRVYFEPLHLDPAFYENFKRRKAGLPVTEAVSKKVLCLPIYPGLKKKEIDRIVKLIKQFCQNKK